MEPVHVNISAVFAAAMAKIFVESIWHGPLFGKLWKQLSGFSPEKNGNKMGQAHFFSLIGSFAMSYVLAYALVFASAYLKMDGVRAGVVCGFWNWLGFIAPVTLGAVLWEGRSWKLWLLLNSNYLVSLLIMGAILAVWK